MCVVVLLLLAITSVAESNVGLTRKLDTLLVLPGISESDSWHGPTHALVQDVSEDAVYQTFSAANSAYYDGHVPESEIEETTELPTTPQPTTDEIVSTSSPEIPHESLPETPVDETPTDTAASTEETDTPAPDVGEEATSEPEDVSPAPEETSPSAEPSPEPQGGETPLEALSKSFFRFVNRATMLLPFASESVITPLLPEEDPAVDGTDASAVEPSDTEDIPAAETLDPSDGNTGIFTEETPQGEEPLVSTTSPEIPEPVSEGPEEETPPSEDLETADKVLNETSDTSITFKDFALPELGSGQFIRNVQLRMSLAGSVSHASTSAHIDVSYSFGDAWVSAGTILLDGEVSNALNGGYFLFALPNFKRVSELEGLQVRVSYIGATEVLERIYIDSAWLQVDTETFDRTILKERLLPQGLAHLRLPTMHEFISADLDFTRDELPKFSLKYESQRNPAIRFIRNLFGRKLAEVEEVMFAHRDAGPVSVVPYVGVTDDGLITIQIRDEDKHYLRPGEYEVSIRINEGGKVFTDTFNFQWGMLAINADQTEYELGDTATIALGALTRNGNTLCDAHLQLYVIDPQEYISEVPVIQSGLCAGNNVTTVPDYGATFTPSVPGTYTMYVERLGEGGEVLSHTQDTFHVAFAHPVALKRTGPSRIYPPSPYRMSLSVTPKAAFEGTLVERVPKSFTIVATDAEISEAGDAYELTWNVALAGNEEGVFAYEFDAPDLSPYLFALGPATLSSETFAFDTPVTDTVTATDTATSSLTGTTTMSALSTSTETVVSQNSGFSFQEHRSWQIASDATGNMILFWDNANGIPTGWTCVSCASTSTFFQRFIQGSSTYNNTGGTTTHTHNASTSLLATGSATTENVAGGTIDTVSHTHTLSPTIATASNLPAYRQLQVIQYTASAGEPASIPTGAIGMFDATVPAGWTQYNDHNGRYLYGENTPGSTGGSDTHTHSVTGTTGAGSGTTVGNRGPDAADGAAAGHTHTVSTTTSGTSNEPPYITVMLGKIDATSTAPNGLISLWTDSVPAAWLDVSSLGTDPFNNKFIKATSTYGSTGGGTSHNHSDQNGIVTSAPNTTVTLARAGTTGSGGAHTHSVNVTNYTTTDHLPPYVTVIVGKRQGNNPVFSQLSYRWYANTNAQTPTDPWPAGGVDLTEREAIGSTSTPVENDDIIRLRISAQVANATATASTTMKLQYASTTSTCAAVTAWFDVGAATSSAEWRGFNNTSVSDHGTVSTTTLASTTVAETYEENGYTNPLPNQISVGGVGEWDFVLEQNGASAGATYCFRMVESSGTVFNTYSSYPQLVTNRAPLAPTLSKLFDNEKTASTSPWFEFVTSDPESQDLTYQLQVDNDSDFSSTVIDHDTENNGTFFENLVVPSDKDPFNSGQLMRYSSTTALTNGVTYWWRVRAKDPLGSNQWGEWVTARSFTIDTALTASAWHQTTEAQFDTSTLVGLDAVGSNQVQLITGSTTGTLTTDLIDFDDGSQGTAWDSLAWNDNETSGDITYHIEYLNENDEWGLIPESDLPGNSTGFDTSPVNLLDLDTDDYNEIRVIADFTNSGGSPSLQDITVNWGYRVATPSITRLFSNEKVGTTTPTFAFNTTDPQGDNLTYQISWSTDTTFTSSTTRTSDTHTGFVNADQGGDLDPFNSGDTVQFTIQNADALTNNTTYWWRVRAKDTTGDDVYSLWTEPRSFTVDTTVTVSTWFQTTEEQFDTDILSGTNALASDVVAVATTATEAMLVYGEGVETSPRYRVWDGGGWGGEGTLEGIGAPLRWAVVKAATTREEYVAATLGTDADINAQVFTLGDWGNLQEVTTSVTDYTARGFDVAYETLSGDAMVAYCDGDADPSYYMWNGSTWSSGGTFNLSLTNNCAWVRLASDPVSDEIIILVRDTAGTYEAQVWSGSAWGNPTTQGSITDLGNEGMAVAYEESGGQAVIVTSDGNPARFRYNTWNGSSWTGVGTQALGNDFEWGELAADEGSDELALCYIDEDLDIGMVEWTGSAWTGQIELEIDGNAKTDPGFSCIYETTSGRDNFIMTTYSDTAATNYSYWNNTSWSTEAALNSIGDSATMRLIRTGVGAILGIFFDDPNDDLLFSSWDGANWSTTTTIENNASVDTSSFGHPYAIVPRNDGREGTVIVSPGISFSEGVGPYWDQMSWVDATPGSSEILYSVQYFDTASSSWKFIPNADLPGNESGTTTSPIDLSGLNVNVYSLIRPYAELTCDGSNNCPTLSDWTITWAEGITISGSLHQYDQVSSTTSGTVAVAVDGVLQVGKTGTVTNGSWSIGNVTAFAGDIITVFVSGANDENEAVGVTRYDGIGDVTDVSLYERHVSLGSNDATTTTLQNAHIGLYDLTNDEDLFHNATGTTLAICADTGCGDAELFVKSGVWYEPSGTLSSHDLENNGTLLAGGNTITLSGSWDNNATATMATSTVIFNATSTTEAIDGSGASNNTFYNVTFGTATNTASWTLLTALDADNNLSISYGTLARGAQAITVGGNLTTGSGGSWNGVGTTTFDGSGTRNWSDLNSTLQNAGHVVVDGMSKTVQLTGNVKAESIRIGADDILDASTSNFDITVLSDWINQNTFVARSGEVFMSATTTNHTITVGSDAFYDLTFNGAGGSWSFTESTLSVNNDLRIATGTVTLPTGTTTVAGSWNSVGGIFAHNNSTLLFTSGSAETIAASGTPFTNNFYTLSFNGSGSWSFLDTHATSSNDFRILQGTVTLPGSQLSVGGNFANSAGTFAHNNGTVAFTSSGARTIDTNASFNSMLFGGSGSWSFIDGSVTALGTVSVTNGTLTLPATTFTIGGSLSNSAAFNHNNGTVLFNSSDAGESINLGGSPLFNALFNSSTGGWTISAHATATNNFTIATTSSFTLASGQTLAVGGIFTNSVGGASTTWTGSTLSLEAGSYTLNSKTVQGDSYETIRIKANTDIKMWNSSAASYVVDAAGSLYSQDHAGQDGDLYIFGAYERTSGNEYWSYATDFDGAALGTSTSRAVDVRFANAASASFTGSLFEILGTQAATTTIANQGSGTYTIFATTSTTTFTYYDFDDLGASGVSLGGSGAVTSLASGAFEPAVNGGTGLSVSSSTIDANPGLQIFHVDFSTTTPILASNVTQVGGSPASYWWFRESRGNVDGEAFDADTGDPGSIRWDDSSLSITISGTVYADDGLTPLGSPTCDGSTERIRVVVGGATAYTGSCAAGNGAFSIPGVVIVGDPVLTIYLDTNGGANGTVITKTPTADITDLNIYQNRIITRHEDVTPLTILDMAVFDADNDSDLAFTAATGTLTVFKDTELHIASSTTFAPGGDITLNGNASSTSFDGSLHIDDNAVFTGSGTSTYTIAGSFTMDQGATFSAASTTVVMTATTTGKTITTPAPQEITFNELMFTGAGGGWNINGDIRAQDDITVSTGTVTGTGDITVVNGSLSGNGTVSMGAGQTTIERSNTLGGTTPWTFDDLVLGNGATVGTTTPGGATTTVLGELTIEVAHFLDAGGTVWNLAGTGTVFVENGTFVEGTSTVRYSGTGATNVHSTTYYNLDLKALGGSPTYTATGLGIIVGNDLTVGGATSTIFSLDTNDPALDVNGDVTIDTTGALVGSGSGAFTVGGSWDNNGTFTGSGGTITFDGNGSVTISAGASSFASVLISGGGTFTIPEHATATAAFALDAGTFTLGSGQSLAVGGTFANRTGGGATTWNGSTLFLYGGGNYEINASTTIDSYDTLTVAGGTQIRMWNASASAYDVSGSLYSQDHANVNGDLYIFGSYVKSSGTDHWSYERDFDGTSITGSPRNVDVYIAGGGSVLYQGGGLSVVGASSATTTIQNQGSGTYAFRIGGNASTTLSYYRVRDTDSAGLTFSGTPNVVNISNGDFEVSANSASAITVGGTVITQNQARTFTNNSFATSSGVAPAVNVTATGTTVSSWRFTNHTGSIDGEAYDSDPNGDPGYIVWDDSAALITISGTVYSDEGATLSSVCDGSTSNIHIRVAGLTSYTGSCSVASSTYSISNIAYSPGDSLIVYIDGETEKAATVSEDPISNINNMDLYENRVIVRHEGTDPLGVADMAAWDSSDDADIPFTATLGSPHTLTLPANRKLIVWTNKEFEPQGNVTVSGGGGGAAYDGTLELFGNAVFDATGSETHTVGGSFVSGAGALFDDETSTFIFTTSGAGRTIDTNDQPFYNLTFNGAGSWTIANTILDVGNDLSIPQGSVTLPGGTTTITGSLAVTGGTFDANGGTILFNSSAAETIQSGGSSFGALTIQGAGSFTMIGTNATATTHLRILNGTFTSATGTFAIGGNFINADTFVHGNGTLRFTSSTSTTVTASSSDLGSTTFSGSGAFTFTDEDVTLLGSLLIENGAVTLASGTLSVGGSFVNSGGTFAHASGTILFNSSDAGETVNPGPSPFHTVNFASAGGGWTIAAHATATGNFSLTSATSFTLASSTSLTVGGIFTNLVGGAATTWTGTTVRINSGSAYTINTKLVGGDTYHTMIVGSSTQLRAWDSAGTIVMADGSSSFYSQDHAGVSGALSIFGNYRRTTGADYWSYATDFDGAPLTGTTTRQAFVSFASGATTTLTGGTLNIVGANGFDTTIGNQGSGTYTVDILGGTFNAQYYSFANLDGDGLTLSGTTTVTSLSEGDFTLAVNGGSLITLASTTLNHNAGLVIANASFATATAITGFNVELIGTTPSAWTFTNHTGNLDGEAFDSDGGDACGSLRWDDSACLLTQQSAYRFRNDDGGEGVPNSEWFDLSWGKRTRVTVTNADATAYTNAAVKLTVPYDGDMQTDFDDLRFTSGGGTTSIPHFIETYTASTEATVWVRVPSLAASADTEVYMYYGNGGASDGSASTTFSFIDTFEDGNISEYSGDTSIFAVDGTFSYERDNALDATGNEGEKAVDGIYRTDVTVSQGQTLRYLQYIDTTSGSGDETCAMFGVQSPGSNNQNYAVCLELFGVDRVSIARDVDFNDTSGIVLATSTISYVTGWHEVEIDWNTDDSIEVTVYRDGSVVATSSATDSTYTQGGVGFTFWFQNGGWDIYSARPLLDTEPSSSFGGEQVPGGASWLAARNTKASGVEIGEKVRTRFLVENTGLTVTDQNYEIEFAPKGSAPSCESVDYSDYVEIPNVASCGTSDLCMETSTNIADLASTTDLLGGEGTFTSGQIVESPSNNTGNITVENGEFTELEYVLTATGNVTDSNYCLRVTNEGTDLDSYSRVAELQLLFSPNITALSLNGGLDITLTGGATTTVYATGTVTDLNGYTDLVDATTTIFRSGVGESCALDNNNCYISGNSLCDFENCSGNSCDVECRTDIYYHADPTDIGTFAGETWRALLSVIDLGGSVATATAPSIDLLTLRAIEVDSAINYGSLEPNSDTGSFNATTTVENIGNDALDVAIEGTDLTDGGSSAIPVSGQRFATSSFTYSACTFCSSLSASSTNYELNLTKPTTTTPAIVDEIFWGIAVPFGVAGAAHQGVNIFYAIGD